MTTLETSYRVFSVYALVNHPSEQLGLTVRLFVETEQSNCGSESAFQEPTQAITGRASAATRSGDSESSSPS